MPDDMQKTELRALARIGAVQSLKDWELRLAALHKEYPDIFVGDMRPQLLKPELQNGNASSWPEFTKRTTVAPSARDDYKREYQRKCRLRKKWGTLKAAAKVAKAVKLVDRKIQRAKRTHRKVSKAPQNFFGTSYEKIYDYVGDHPDQTVTQIAKGLGQAHPANCTKQLHKMQAIGMLTRAKAFPHGWSRGAVSEAAALKAGAIAPRETKA